MFPHDVILYYGLLTTLSHDVIDDSICLHMYILDVGYLMTRQRRTGTSLCLCTLNSHLAHISYLQYLLHIARPRFIIYPGSDIIEDRLAGAFHAAECLVIAGPGRLKPLLKPEVLLD